MRLIHHFFNKSVASLWRFLYIYLINNILKKIKPFFYGELNAFSSSTCKNYERLNEFSLSTCKNYEGLNVFSSSNC